MKSRDDRLRIFTGLHEIRALMQEKTDTTVPGKLKTTLQGYADILTEAMQLLIEYEKGDDDDA